MDQDTWKNDNVMNLYFNNFHRSADEKGMSIATATLRLYRVPSENTTKVTGGKTPDCDSSSTSEEDKLLRVSIYWYSRSIRKKKGDSKVSLVLLSYLLFCFQSGGAFLTAKSSRRTQSGLN